MNLRFQDGLESDYQIKAIRKIHKRNLQEINFRSKSNLRYAKHQPISKTSKLSTFTERRKTIQIENLNILSRLNNIKQRKGPLTSFRSPKSLNFSFRKQEATRIVNENLNIFRRLSDVPSCICVRRQEKEFRKVLYYKKTILKASMLKNFGNFSFNLIKQTFNQRVSQRNDNNRSFETIKGSLKVIAGNKTLEKQKSKVSLMVENEAPIDKMGDDLSGIN